MIHIRIDNCEKNSDAEMACGLRCPLPEGDKYFFASESYAEYKADCQGCNPGGPRKYGTPISELSGRPGQPGYERFVSIAKSWGHD
jgi:hypothetical protein